MGLRRGISAFAYQRLKGGSDGWRVGEDMRQAHAHAFSGF